MKIRPNDKGPINTEDYNPLRLALTVTSNGDKTFVIYLFDFLGVVLEQLEENQTEGNMFHKPIWIGQYRDCFLQFWSP